MEHYRYANEICEEIKRQIVEENDPVANSSIKRYIKSEIDEENARKNTNASSAIVAALSAEPNVDNLQEPSLNKRRPSLRTSLGWD